MARRVLVIGGGAAGMMAAITAAEQGAHVIVLEPNERLGKKLNITGKGRCNLTNRTDLNNILAHTPRNGKFLYSALSGFGPEDVIDFFEGLGVKLKTERGNRVFPVSDRAFDISAALERRMKVLKVNWIQDRAVNIIADDIDIIDKIDKIEKKEKFSRYVTGVQGENKFYAADAVILATGGVSYPATGSTGEGHYMARKLGHEITPLSGSLVPLCEKGNTCARMRGLSLRNINLIAWETRDGKNIKKIFEGFGELLFTHFGVSGPLILTASAYMNDFEKNIYKLEIDLKPALDEAELDRRLISDFKKYANRDYLNALDDLLPKKLIPVFVEISGIPEDLKMRDLTRIQRRKILELCKRFEIIIAGPRPITEAVVTRGGVRVSELNPATMESRLIKNLYMAGEIIDVDAHTGGFNLQIAWSTGRTAGIAAAREK